MQNVNLSHFPTLKEMGMLPEKKTDFAVQLQKLLNEFSARFKRFKSHGHLCKIFSYHFTLTLKKTPWISKWN